MVSLNPSPKSHAYFVLEEAIEVFLKFITSGKHPSILSDVKLTFGISSISISFWMEFSQFWSEETVNLIRYFPGLSKMYDLFCA